MPRAILILVLVMTTLRGAAPTAAQPAPAVTDAQRDRARELAREGAALFQSGNRRAAAAKFEEAYALFPTPALLYNLGKAYAGLSDHVRAHRALAAYVRATAASDDPTRRAEVDQLLEELAHHVGVVTITAPRFAGASIEVDGAALGTAPLTAAIAVGPGVHELTAHRDQLLVARMRVTIVAGGQPSYALVRVEDERETVFITKEVGARPVYKRWWFWTAVGSAAASAAVIYIAANPRQVNAVGSPPLGQLHLDDFTPQ